MQISNDWLDPVATGMAPAIYFDDNTPAGVPIDGQDDSVASTPLNAWTQTSGGLGSVVQVQQVSTTGGAIENYYSDNATPFEPEPTGDGLRYGDAGFRVTNPTGEVSLDSANYILPSGQPNVGETYRAYNDNPLQAEVTAQECGPAGVGFRFSPFPIFVNSATSFTASVREGKLPIESDWEFGDGGTGTGSPASHTYSTVGVYPVTLTVSNSCGTAETTRNVMVFAPGQAHAVFLPLLHRGSQRP
jgi:PKD repeat protein